MNIEKLAPNGMTDYLETFYQFAVSIEKNLHDTGKVTNRGECWELAQAWTTEFETEFLGRNWDDGAYFDEVETFSENKINEIELTNTKN